MPARYQLSVVFTSTGEPGFELSQPTNSELVLQLAPFLQGDPGDIANPEAIEAIARPIAEEEAIEERYDFDTLVATNLNVT